MMEDGKFIYVCMVLGDCLMGRWGRWGGGWGGGVAAIDEFLRVRIFLSVSVFVIELGGTRI